MLSLSWYCPRRRPRGSLPAKVCRLVALGREREKTTLTGAAIGPAVAVDPPGLPSATRAARVLPCRERGVHFAIILSNTGQMGRS